MSASNQPEQRWKKLSSIIGQLKSGYTFLPRNNDTIQNTQINPDCPKILVLRCSSHADVEASLTHLVLFDQIKRACPGALVDFAFYPPQQDQIALAKAGFAWPISISCLYELSDFDLVFISVSYVLELLNILPILEASCLSRWSSERNQTSPLLILGGSAALSAQAVLRQQEVHGTMHWDALVDAFFFGEVEDSMSGLISAVQTAERKDILSKWSKVPGVWVPTLTKPDAEISIKKAICTEQMNRTLPYSYPVLNGHDAGTCRLQISYGCPFRCSFCFEGHERKPYRDVPSGTLIEQSRRLRQSTGARALDLISFNFNTHKELSNLMPQFNMIYRHVHYMSQRLDILNRTKFLLENELAADKRAYTLGIEGISRRFRLYFDKRLTDHDIAQLITRLLQAKVKEIKFFYILSGLETTNDIEEFSLFISNIHDKHRLLHSGCRLIFSFGVLCRMPFTPLQFGPCMMEAEKLAQLIDACRAAVEAVGFEFRTAFSAIEQELAQILSLGGHNLHCLLAELFQSGISYGPKLPSILRSALNNYRKSNHEEYAVMQAERNRTWAPFFSFVDIGISQDELYTQYTRCQKALVDPQSVSADEGTIPDQRPGIDQRKLLSNLSAEKNRAPCVYLSVRVPFSCAGATPEWMEAWLIRGLVEILGGLENIIDAQLCGHESEEQNWPKIWYGQSIFRLNYLAGSTVPADILVRLGQVSTNGLAIVACQQDFRPAKKLLLEFEVPLAIEQVGQIWNRIIQEIPIGCTLTKSDTSFLFQVPPRFYGKKSLFSLELSFINVRTTHCSILAGPRLNTDACQAKLLSFQAKSFCPIFISSIIDT